MAYRYAGRTEQHKASFARRRDANVLRAAQRWRGAMYLLGYAIECRLKARLMERHGVYRLDALEERLSSRLGAEVELKTHSLAYLFELADAHRRLRGHVRRDYNMCVRRRVDWRYSPDAGNKEDCNAFLQCAERLMKFIDANV